jgi:outer membrane immunogenic protein
MSSCDVRSNWLLGQRLFWLQPNLHQRLTWVDLLLLHMYRLLLRCSVGLVSTLAATSAWLGPKATWSDSFGDSFSNAQKAVFAGGGQVGANYQFNWLVVGVEADFDWLANNSNSSNAVFVPGVGSLQFSANDRWMTTLAGRVGVAANNWLFYAKGGGGWVGVNNPTLTNVTTGGSISVSNSNSNSGWLAGAGIEWAFAPNWTAKIEYDFLGLNNSSLTVPVGTPLIGGDVITVTNRDVQTLTVGINYLFNWQ